MKNLLRKKYKEIRKNLSKDAVEKKSTLIQKHLISQELWINSKNIMCYLSFGNEVKTQNIISQGWAENKTMIVPVCQDNKIITPYLLESFHTLKPNNLGILEPEASNSNIFPLDLLELCLIPGIIFDKSGNRIGFGGGYYDRFLKKVHPSTVKIALSFDNQISPENLPFDKYDIKMDFICTEKGFYKCPF